MDAIDALERLRDSEVPIALVYDEYGHFEGVVTPADILDVIAGAFRSEEGAAEPEAIERADGSWLFSGSMPADEMADRISLPLEPTRNYQTVAGFFLAHHERMPSTGESFETDGWRFEVVDMDGQRIDKLLASRIPGEE